MNEAVDLVDRGDPAHAAEGLRELGGEAHDVILCGGRSITELICNARLAQTASKKTAISIWHLQI